MNRGSNQRSVLPGRILSVTGVIFGVIGAFYVSIAMNILGIILGMSGYAFGSRILGGVACVLSLILLFIGIFFGRSISQF